MNEKGWNAAAKGSGILAIVACFMFLIRLLIGKIDFWTILFFSLIVTGTVAYVVIHMMLRIRKLTPTEDSVADQVSNTREFVGLFFSLMAMFATAIGVYFFSGKAIGKTAGLVLFIGTILAVGIKIYDVQRITSAKMKKVRLLNEYQLRPLSRAEQIGLGMLGVGFIGMFFFPSFLFVSYIGLLIFLIRPIVHHVEGRIVDLMLMWINFITILLATILIIFK